MKKKRDGDGAEKRFKASRNLVRSWAQVQAEWNKREISPLSVAEIRETGLAALKKLRKMLSADKDTK